MMDGINFQTRICPTCHDDHGASSPCKLYDIFLIKEVWSEIETKNDMISKLQEYNEKLKDALNELARYCKCQHCKIGLLTERCHVQKLLSDKQ